MSTVFEASRGRGPGQWWPVEHADGQMSATIFCRDCSRASSLSAHHIQPDGTVSPSCVCPHAKADEVECPCGFHEFVKLVGWGDSMPPPPASVEMLQVRVAEELKRALKAQGVRQSAVAARLEVSEAEISARLSGYRNLTLASIYEMADLADLVVVVQFKPCPA